MSLGEKRWFGNSQDVTGQEPLLDLSDYLVDESGSTEDRVSLDSSSDFFPGPEDLFLGFRTSLSSPPRWVRAGVSGRSEP